MIKNQESVFYKLRSDKDLSKLFPLLQFTLYVLTHFVQFLNTLYCSPITLVQVLQIFLNFVINDNGQY